MPTKVGTYPNAKQSSMARLYKGQSVPTKVGTYPNAKQSSMARLDQGQSVPTKVGTYQEQDMRRTASPCVAQGSAPKKNAARKGGISVSASPEP